MPGAGQGQDDQNSTDGAAPRRWRRSERAIWREALDDVVVADGRGCEAPFALAGGARLWRALSEPVGIGDLPVIEGETHALSELLEDLCQRGVVDRLWDK